jgi:hypothetical protein
MQAMQAAPIPTARSMLRMEGLRRLLEVLQQIFLCDF